MQDDVLERERLFLTPADVAAALGVSSATVLRLIHSGALPAIRVSERIYRVGRPAFEMFTAGSLPGSSRPAPIKRVAGPVPPLVHDEVLPRRAVTAGSDH